MNTLREDGTMIGEDYDELVDLFSDGRISRDITVKCGGLFMKDLYDNQVVFSLDVLKNVARELDNKPNVVNEDEVNLFEYREEGEYFDSVFITDKKDKIEGMSRLCFVCEHSIFEDNESGIHIKYHCNTKQKTQRFHPDCFIDFLEALSISAPSFKVTHKL
jgi:hypothetical protein